jgi:hypothetical protein
MPSFPLYTELTLSGLVALPIKDVGHHIVPTKPVKVVSLSNLL